MLGRNLRQLLIVGTNPRALRFAEKILSRPELGYRLVGFVDDDWAGINEFKRTGHALVANFQSFPELLKSQVVDEVIISLPLKSLYDEAARILAVSEEHGIVVRCLSNIFNARLGGFIPEQFAGDPLLCHYTAGMTGWPGVIKRAMDVFLSLFAVSLMSPLFLAAAILVKITSPGPAFFVQERVGLNKRRFRLYKFRTMVNDAEKKLRELERFNEVLGPVFKIKNDPRITKIGKLLRKTSIDELPQLFNVLKRDMSLVGPRPLSLRDYERFNEDGYRRRFSVRPGITCLWQVSGRSDIDFARWMALDLEYIDRWSLFLDLKILLKTIPAILRGSGAA